MVIHNGVAYFTGPCLAFAPTLREQTEGVCKRYDELFAQYGMKKENILMANAYIKDMSKFSEYDEVFKAWVGTDHAPAGVAVQAQPDQTSALGDNILRRAGAHRRRRLSGRHAALPRSYPSVLQRAPRPAAEPAAGRGAFHLF